MMRLKVFISLFVIDDGLVIGLVVSALVSMA